MLMKYEVMYYMNYMSEMKISLFLKSLKGESYFGKN